MRMPPIGGRAGAAALVTAGFLAACLAPVSLGAPATVPNPCQAVPGGVIAAAFGLAQPPPSTLSTVTNASTCSYKHGVLTVSVGYTAITNPAAPLKVGKVSGLPNGLYETYSGSTQSEVTFFRGAASNGLYAVVRNFARMPRAKLEKIARALYAGLGSADGGPSGGTIVP